MSKITLKELLILSDDLVQEWCDITLQNSNWDTINIELDVNEGEVHVQYFGIDASRVWGMYANHHEDWSNAVCASCSLEPDDTDWFVSTSTFSRLSRVSQRAGEMWDTLSRYSRKESLYGPLDSE